MYGVIIFIFIGVGGAKMSGRCFKSIIWGGRSQRGEQFLSGNFSVLNADILENLILTGYCESLYRIPLFTILAVLPVLYDI